MPSFIITNRKKERFKVFYDEEDTELLAQYTWCVSHGYVVTNDRRPDGNKYMTEMHRRVMEAPDGIQVDHINGNRSDNRKENLRLCTKTQNARNRKLDRNNTSGYKGVCWNKLNKNFRAYIRVDGAQKNLGSYQTVLAGARAYNMAAKQHFGEFARLNKIP